MIKSSCFFIKISTILLVVCLNQMAFSQVNGTLRGSVFDKNDNTPIAFANVLLFKNDAASNISDKEKVGYTDELLEKERLSELYKGTSTNEKGEYEFLNLPAGSYRLRVSYVGYFYEKNILIEAGKLAQQSVGLDLTGINLKEEVTVWVPLFSTLLDQMELSPAVYDDPARTTALMPGVINTNDQANHISVRGNNPSGLKWYLNGLEIPNPNHTPNAGTASDRISTSGGGVNMIKPYFTNSDFFNGAFEAGYGNAIGGAIDLEVINLKRPYQPRNSIKVGIIGMEAISRGFFNEKSDASYNLNVRYSTVGLLTNVIGLDFGGEKITFMDANLSAYFPTKKYGDFSIYNISGLSSNIFETQRDTSLWQEQKDQFDIDFYSATNISGISHTKKMDNIFKNPLTWETVAMYSTWNSSRNAYRLNDEFEATLLQQDSLRHHRFSFRTELSTKNWSLEGKLTQLNYQFMGFDSLANYQSNGTLSGFLFEPNFYIKKQIHQHHFNIGLHTMFFTATGSSSIEPRATYTLDFEKYDSELQLAYGFHSQMQAPEVYLSTDFQGNAINDDLDFTRSHHVNLKFLKDNPYKNYGFQVQAYYQYLQGVPIVNQANRSFSVINDINALITAPLENAGNGQNYGVEFDLRTVFKTVNISLNASLYQSLYRGGDGIWRNTRFNGNYITNLIVRKNWKFQTEKSRKNRISNQNIGIIARAFYAGGIWESPIDVALSQQEGYTIFVENDAYSLRQPDFFKIDFRFFWEKNNYKSDNYIRKHTLALDIQNLTNAQNFGFNYFDVLRGEVVTKYQLGLIPLLSWEMTF